MNPVSATMWIVIGGVLLASSSVADPPQSKVEFENDSVLVLRIQLGPREKIPMHDVTARVAIWLTDVHLRDTSADGRTQELHRTPGSVEWVPAQRHAGENLADTPIQFLAVVPKSEGAPARHSEPQGRGPRH